MLTHASLGWSPTLFSPGFFYSGRPAGVVCMANTAKAEGHGWGTSLLKGSCNFHSRVLLKLVLRPQPIRAPFCPPTLSDPLHPDFPLYAAAAGQLAVLSQPPFLHLYLFVWICELLIFQTTCTQQTRISWSLKNIDNRCGYGVYLFLYHFQNH